MKELSKSHAKFLSSLSLKKNRQKEQLFVAEGTKTVFDLLDKFEPFEIILSKNFEGSLPDGIDKEKVSVADKKIMDYLSSLSNSPDVIGIFHLPDENDAFLILDNKYYLLLDGIQDPGNMGTILRTADWFGFHEVILSDDCVDVFNAKTIQATMGSLRNVSIKRTNLNQFIGQHSEMPVIGLMLEGKDIFNTEFPKGGFVIMGNEGHGISEEIRKRITLPLYIPCYDTNRHPDSLNVGVACGVTLALLRNKK